MRLWVEARKYRDEMFKVESNFLYLIQIDSFFRVFFCQNRGFSGWGILVFRVGLVRLSSNDFLRCVFVGVGFFV